MGTIEMAAKATSLLCDECGCPMSMRVDQSTVFECPHCGQQHYFYQDGKHISSLCTLFPSMPIKDYSPELKRRYIHHWAIERHLDNGGRLLAGLHTEEQYLEGMQGIRDSVLGFWKEVQKIEAEPQTNRQWWRCLLRLG